MHCASCAVSWHAHGWICGPAKHRAADRMVASRSAGRRRRGASRATSRVLPIAQAARRRPRSRRLATRSNEPVTFRRPANSAHPRGRDPARHLDPHERISARHEVRPVREHLNPGDRRSGGGRADHDQARRAADDARTNRNRPPTPHRGIVRRSERIGEHGRRRGSTRTICRQLPIRVSRARHEHSHRACPVPVARAAEADPVVLAEGGRRLGRADQARERRAPGPARRRVRAARDRTADGCSSWGPAPARAR